MDNPNEYDDDAFTEASNSAQFALGTEFEALWDAGASLKNLEEEIASALDSALGGNFRVQISGGA